MSEWETGEGLKTGNPVSRALYFSLLKMNRLAQTNTLGYPAFQSTRHGQHTWRHSFTESIVFAVNVPLLCHGGDTDLSNHMEGHNLFSYETVFSHQANPLVGFYYDGNGATRVSIPTKRCWHCEMREGTASRCALLRRNTKMRMCPSPPHLTHKRWRTYVRPHGIRTYPCAHKLTKASFALKVINRWKVHHGAIQSRLVVTTAGMRVEVKKPLAGYEQSSPHQD